MTEASEENYESGKVCWKNIKEERKEGKCTK